MACSGPEEGPGGATLRSATEARWCWAGRRATAIGTRRSPGFCGQRRSATGRYWVEMDDVCSFRVLLSASLMLAAGFASPTLRAADEAPASEAGSGAGLDHPAGVLERFAHDEHQARVSNAWWTMGGGAVLVASGLITVAGDHDGWGHLVWISGGISLLGGLAQLLIPSELEQLESGSGGR